MPSAVFLCIHLSISNIAHNSRIQRDTATDRQLSTSYQQPVPLQDAFNALKKYFIVNIFKSNIYRYIHKKVFNNVGKSG